MASGKPDLVIIAEDITGEALHIKDLNDADLKEYKNFTRKLRIFSNALLIAGSVGTSIGVVTNIAEEKFVPQSILLPFIIAVFGLIGNRISNFRQRATDLATSF